MTDSPVIQDDAFGLRHGADGPPAKTTLAVWPKGVPQTAFPKPPIKHVTGATGPERGCLHPPGGFVPRRSTPKKASALRGFARGFNHAVAGWMPSAETGWKRCPTRPVGILKQAMSPVALLCLGFALGSGGWPLQAAEPIATSSSYFRSWPVRPGAGGESGFTLQSPTVTGVRFTNVLQGDLSLTNAVTHNGSGVALGDVDDDGRPDLYLCGLQVPNRLYRNLGGWRFEPMVLGEAACAGQLSTGATFADVDGDGDLDLLVNGIASGTRLFLNDGKGRWTEAKDSGLSRTASATSLTLADIDGDGDLDLYCTHYLDHLYLADPTTQLTMGQQGGRPIVAKVNGQPANLPPWLGRFEVSPDGQARELGEADGLYRNDGNGRFTPIQAVPGTFLDEDGRPIPPDRALALGAMFRDINGDGAPDLYVANDSGAPDRFWINTGKGSFRAIDRFALRHGSHSSMGLDFADLDRDGHDDLLVLDMLARSHAKRMMHPLKPLPEFDIRERPDTRPLLSRNTLFFGRADGSFAEAALWAGLAATDWSWCPVFLDVDLDGYEDLLLTSGFEQDVLDRDSTDQIGKRKWTPAEMKRYRQIHPRWPSGHAAFRNRGDGTFEPAGQAWRFDQPGVANGMAVADLDGDGDLDVAVNNLNAAASLYRNDSPAPRIAVRLKGVAPNTQGIGARLTLTGGPVTQSQEMIAGGRYLSGDQALRVFAAATDVTRPLRLEVRWRNGDLSTLTNLQPNQLYEIDQTASAQKGQHPQRPAVTPHFTDVSALLGHVQVEDAFDDWAQQPLLPRRLSRPGPGLAWYDINSDGWEDLLVTAALGGKLTISANRDGKAFALLQGAERAEADQGAVVGWSDGKGNRDFLVAISDRELPTGRGSQLIHYTPKAAPRRLPAGPSSVGALAVVDADGDGDLDLFVGGRLVPGRYPEPASSALWRNEKGEPRPDPAWSAPFQAVGLVNGATFGDLDGDGDADLALALEWGPLRVFRNEGGRFEDVTAAWGFAAHTGLWTGVALGDFDGDGRLDLVAGNRGRNSTYELNQPGKLGLFHGEWNGDGSVQMIEAWQGGGTWLPVRDRAWLERGLPDLPQRFATHEAFSKATVPELLGERFPKAKLLEAAELESAVFLNRGGRFERLPLPREAQLAPASSVNVGDLDGDGTEDLFISQNFFGNASDLSRDDGGRGLWLRGKGDGKFTAVNAEVSGIRIEGEQRAVALADFNHDGRLDLSVAQNNGATKLYQNQLARPGLRVVLKGPPQNPDAVGALLRVRYAGEKAGPVRSVSAGTGYWSQDGTVQVLGLAQPPAALWIRWPGGREQTVPVEAGAREMQVSF